MFDLESGVHLVEGETTSMKQELDGPRIPIPKGTEPADRDLDETLA
jgi:hypothetical protein